MSVAICQPKLCKNVNSGVVCAFSVRSDREI